MMLKILDPKDVEWYSKDDAKTYPKRIKIQDTWREVFSFKKQVFEDFLTRKRTIVFLCHIGDNEVVKVEIMV